MSKFIITKLKASLLIFFLLFSAYPAADFLKKFTFNEDKALNGWRNMVLKGHVSYQLMKEGSEGYIQASSEKAASALYYRINFKAEDYPLLQWKWSVLKFPNTTEAVTAEERDDYAARIYVIFPFLSFSSSKFLEYVWAEHTPVDTIMTSPAGENVKIIVVRSGRAANGEWFSETRNVYDDYVKAFGEKPKRLIRALAIMCDADSTNTSAVSLFDDIAVAGR
ncbi:MAG: DUF3047 domain-containing protein [Candidatus Omnitrophica bacterium]|nr:DUF3047 domain-containing protein [Candidatus Omnitrophota bacterium]